MVAPREGGHGSVLRDERAIVTQFDRRLGASSTPIPGLELWDLPVHGDSRGWFKENWQRQKMMALGLDDFAPVQNNISFNDAVGTTRGIHAEPWDKWVSVASGRIFGAWVDLREGETFGVVFSVELDPSRAIFVPRGVGNAYQTLERDTAYSYLVNDHWSPDASYTFLNLADEHSAIAWPIPLENAELSDKDRGHPRLENVVPVSARKTLVIGAGGQLGKALAAEFAEQSQVEFATRADLDLTSDDLASARRWQEYDTIINAAAYTAVDEAESPEGRRLAWQANVTGVAALSQIASAHRLTLVHVSSDYVFDGSASSAYLESDPICPLGVYGQTKAAGDAIVVTVPRHYTIRTSWVIGDGHNFVRTMAGLAARGVQPRVVNDQVGRLTFTVDIARGIRHLLSTRAPFGTYNLTGSGDPVSWAEVAKEIFAVLGVDPERVTGISTAEYFASKDAAPRPANSALDLGKMASTGFYTTPWRESLATFLAQ